MKRSLILGGIALPALLLLFCGKKDDALLIPLGIQASQSSAAPSVPQEDLSPVNNGSSGTGNVSAIIGDSATPGGGASGEGSGSTGEGSGSSGEGSGSSGEGSGSSGGTAPALNTSAFFTGKDYSHVDGKWYLDGTTLFTYDKNNGVGFTLENMQAGTYTVTIEGGHWVKHGTEQGLPAGFSAFQLMVGAAGNTTDASLAASSSGTKTVTVQIVIPEGKSVLMISWLNQACAAESGPSGGSKDSKSKDSKSKDSKSKDSKSKDTKSKDSKSKDSKSKDSKSGGSDKVSVCHVPPGNPDNKQTLSIDKSALSAHLGHGDSEGGCLVCANFGVSTVKVQRVGDTGLGANIAGAMSKRNLLIAGIIALVAAAGIVGLRILGNRSENA